MVSLAVHALLIGLWVGRHDPRPVTPEAPEPLSVWLLPAPPRPAARPPEPVRDRRKDERPAAAMAPRVPSAPAAVTTAPAAPAAVTEAAPAQPSAAQILEDSRSDVGKIGRDLRAQDGVSPLRGKDVTPTLKPSGKWARFAQQLENAHINKAPGIVVEEYTQPDGRVLYRTTQGGKVVCRQSGSTGPANTWRSEEAVRAGAGSKSTLDMQNSAGEVLCPESERDWVKR